MARCIPKSNPESVDSPRASDLELVRGVETALRGGEVTIRPFPKVMSEAKVGKPKLSAGERRSRVSFLFVLALPIPLDAFC